MEGNPFEEAIRYGTDGVMMERYLRTLEDHEKTEARKVELEEKKLELEKEAAEKREAKLMMYDGQLEHINKQLKGQTGPENILKLAQAEEIIYGLREREEKHGNTCETEQSNKV